MLQVDSAVCVNVGKEGEQWVIISLIIEEKGVMAIPAQRPIQSCWEYRRSCVWASHKGAIYSSVSKVDEKNMIDEHSARHPNGKTWLERHRYPCSNEAVCVCVRGGANLHPYVIRSLVQISYSSLQLIIIAEDSGMRRVSANFVPKICIQVIKTTL